MSGGLVGSAIGAAANTDLDQSPEAWEETKVSKNQKHIPKKRSPVPTQPGHPQGLGQGRQGTTGQTCLRAHCVAPFALSLS